MSASATSTSLAGRVALVTGASSGIGRAIAHMLASLGATLAVCARREDRLEALAGEIREAHPDAKVWTTGCDLREERAIKAMFARIAESLGPVGVLVNNAGLAKPGALCEPATDAWREMFEVNVLALAVCTSEAVRQMQRAELPGHVVHISSLAAYRSPAAGAFYGATKHAVRALTEGLRRELHAAHSPIRVSAVSPGIVETEFGAGFFGSQERADELYASYQALTPSDVAEAVKYAVTAPAHVQVHDVLLRPQRQAD